MARVLLGVTGSVAAIRTPDLATALAASGNEVRIVATGPALYFFDPATLPASATLYRDADEWPAPGYRRGDEVLHIALRDWADALLLAPLDANTLAKFALGLCDNLLTSILRAWDYAKPIVLAPAMNTRMWQSPVTRRHLGQILEDHAFSRPGVCWTPDEAEAVFIAHSGTIRLVSPVEKRLACGDVGMGAMAEVETIISALAALGAAARD
jgi:phosphopantothenoylcysteine decarboxylase